MEKIIIQRQQNAVLQRIEWCSKDLKDDDIYPKWKSQYNNSKGADAAYWAGSIVCYKYEKPKDTDNQAKVRASNAKNVYNAMMGSK